MADAPSRPPPDPPSASAAPQPGPEEAAQPAAESPPPSDSSAYTSDSDDASPGPHDGLGDGSPPDDPQARADGAAAPSRRPRPKPSRGVGNGKVPVQSAPPIVLLLAGVPGSGKSTFSRRLLEESPVAWVHVNQDAIRSGRPGKREQCLTAMGAALDDGACCVVDRCHGDAQQRRSFLQLAAQRRVAVHCVALQPPLDLCARRVAERTDHPGGVQGKASRRVVYQMAKQQQQGQAWPPAAAEGLASVMHCHDDADANVAVRAWAAYGSGAAAVGVPAAAAAGPGDAAVAGSTEDPAAATLAIWAAHAAKRKPAPGGILSFFKAKDVKTAEPAAAAAAASKGAGDTKPAASPLAAGKVARPVEAKAAGAGSATRPALGAVPLSAPRATAGAAAAGAVAAAGRTETGAKRKAAGDADGGAGAEQRGAKRAASEAQRASAARSQGASGTSGVAARESSTPGKAAAAPLAPTSGGEGLGDACGSMGYGDASGPDGPGQDTRASHEAGGGGGSAGGGGEVRAEGRNAFALLMAASAARKTPGARGQIAAAAAKGSSNAGTGGGASRGRSAAEPDQGDGTDPRFRLTAPWAQPLRAAALDPEKTEQKVLYKDDKVVMVADAFPKARHHALVLARDPQLRSIADLRKDHVPLLLHMQQVAQDYIQQQRKEHPDTVAFKVGFHAVPSMCQLHMHVVSQDFDSPLLKNKKHWNSFTTRFFLPFEAVLHEVDSVGRLALMSADEEKQLEGQGLRCHGCSDPFRTIPDLKRHIVSCNRVKQLPGL